MEVSKAVTAKRGDIYLGLRCCLMRLRLLTDGSWWFAELTHPKGFILSPKITQRWAKNDCLWEGQREPKAISN